MKGLKNKMSIKAFCKRGLAVMLACAMVATSLPALNVRADETTNAVAEETEWADFCDTADNARQTLVGNAKANSEEVNANGEGSGNDGPARWAFNGEDGNWWHSRYNWGWKGDQEVNYGQVSNGAIWIQSGFGKIWGVAEVQYAPRKSGANCIGDYEVQIACVLDGEPNDSDFITIKTGKFENTADVQTVELDKCYRATHVRLVAYSCYANGGTQHVTARKIAFYGKNVDANAEVSVQSLDFSRVNSLYEQNAVFDKSGIVLENTYSDDTVSVMNVSESATVEGYDATMLGKQTLTVSYQNVEGTYDVGVVTKFADSEKLMENAKADSEQKDANGEGSGNDGPAKWAFNGEDGNWWHTRWSGTPLSGEKESGTVSAANEIGIQTGFGRAWDVRAIHYRSRTDQLANVIENYRVEIANLANPMAEPKTSDFVPVKTGTLSNTNAEQIIDLGEFYRATHVRLVTVSTHGGNTYVTASMISFYGMDVKIEVKEEVGISLDATSVKKDYFTEENLDCTGLIVNKVFNDGTTETLNEDEYTVSGYDKSATGTQTITVTYKEFTATYQVSVVETGHATDGRFDYPVGDMTVSAGSEYTGNGGSTGDGVIDWAFDNNVETWWHSNYSAQWDGVNTSRENYLWVQMNFKELTVVDAIRYLPRNGNGAIYGYKILGTTNGTDWVVLTTGDWTSSVEWKIAEFTPVELKAVKLISTSSRGDSWASATEIRVRTADEAVITDTIEMYVGDELTKDISDVPVGSMNPAVTTAKKVTTVVGTKIELYDHESDTGSSLDSFSKEVNSSIELRDAEVELTNVGENIYKAYNPATQKYVVKTGSAHVGLADNAEGAENQLILQPTTNEDGTVTYRVCRASDSQRYIIFFKEKMLFDTNRDYTNNDEWTGPETRGSYELVLLEKQEIESESDIIPGYARATAITSGKTYLITYIWSDGSVIVLYPNASSTGTQTKLVGNQVDINENELVIKGVAEGITHVVAGDDVYEVVVKPFTITATADSVRDNGQLGPDGKPEKDPCRIIDGDKGNNWLSDPADSLADSWVNFELPKAKIVDGLKVYYGSANYVHKAYEVLVSLDGQSWTKVCEGTFANTAGEKTIKFKPVETKHVRLVPTAKYGNELAIWEAEILYSEKTAEEWFIGGSLRMDYADDYDKTCLRFMYEFPSEFNGMTVDATTEDNDGGSWKWTYGKTESMGNTKGVADGRWQVKDNGMVESNIVFTNIGRSNYSTSLYTQLAVTYSDASGANTLTVYDTVVAERSVNDVAGAIENAYKDSVDEREVKQYNYALGILGKTASAQ